jgi:hypothetical protein
MRRLALLLICGSAFGAFLGPIEARAASSGVVEGTVTPLAWAQEVEVCVVEIRPSETCTEPGGDGSYKLLDVPAGGARIEFTPSFRSGLLKQYYEGVGKLSEAKTIVLSPTSPTAMGIDAKLLEGGTIEGTVAAASGAPLPEVEVCAVSVGAPTVRSCGETGAAGEYELHSLPNGTYRVEFWGTRRSAEYEPGSDPPVGVAAGNVTTDVNAILSKGAQIRGIVTAASGGNLLADVPVCLFATAASEPQRCTDSDEEGEYSFVGLRGGSYQVGFSLDPTELGWQAGFTEDGFESQYYDGVASRAEAATVPLIAPAIVRDVDASLATPQVPPPPSPAPLVASPLIAAPPVISAPTSKKAVCKKGYRKKKAKGKVRCVKQGKKQSKTQRGKKPHRHKQRKMPHTRTTPRVECALCALAGAEDSAGPLPDLGGPRSD